MARILVVDDEPHVTCVLSRWLERSGHTVTRAEDGERARDLLCSQPFDVLITDVDMPRLDGLSLIAEGGVTHSLAGVVVLTGRSDYEALETLVARTNVLLVPKPFSPTRIAAIVAELTTGCCVRAP